MNLEPRVKWGIAVITLLLLLILNNQRSAAIEANKAMALHLRELSQEAQSFAKLHKAWGGNKEGQKLVNKLKTIQAPAEQFKKGKKIVIRYSNLSQAMLNRITHTILSSDAQIVHFEVQKTKEGNRVDVEVLS